MGKGEATRARIIDQAVRLAATHGLSAVSLADVAGAVGLSKSGLFKHFDSKDDMLMAVVDMVMDKFNEVTWAATASVPPGRERLEAVFARWLDWEEYEWSACGCPLMAFSVELDDQPGDLRDRLLSRLFLWRAEMIREFRRMREPPLTESEAHAAYFQMKSFALGHYDARRMMGDESARRSATEAFNALLDRTSRSPEPA